MSSETRFWNNIVRPSLLPFGILHRIENVVELGTPDVTYCLRSTLRDGPGFSGWFELKHVHCWPARPASFLRFKRYSKEQAEWLCDWARIRPRGASLLVQVGIDYFLLPGSNANNLHRGMTKQQIINESAVFSYGVFPTGRIIKWLTERT